ncbi:MAG: ABC transporter ATP-binding protein [Planctomycetota bacterium]
MSANTLATAHVCRVRDVHHRYGETTALSGVDLQTSSGQIVALLGKNGSGKTTLFRLVSTMMPLQQGTIEVAGVDLKADPLSVRRQIGIVFQSPSLDVKLTVEENINCQAALYGISGATLRQRKQELLEQLKLADRRKDYCQALSGGLKRRVELAKGMLHRPKLLLLDEPSTGLDPAARLDLWQILRCMAEEGMSILMTTHLLEEADKADLVAILANGRKVIEGSPAELRGRMGQGVITIETEQVDASDSLIREAFDLSPQRLPHQLRIHTQQGAALVPQLAEVLGSRAASIRVGSPSLEDVFIAETGQTFD